MIVVTENAVKKILEMSSKEQIEPRIRAGIIGGGCSGYQHKLFFEEKEDVKETDHVFNFDGIELVVDMISITYLEGTTIDYVDGLMGAGFKFVNSRYKKTCGCGSSFSI